MERKISKSKKKILIFSLGPIFRDHVHGGSQKVLREVALYLGKLGHNVTIYCVERKDNNKIFKLGKNVVVHPVLRFKETFPASYKTAPYNLWNIINVLENAIKKHDIFYIHDAGLNFPFICQQKIPTIISLRDFLYPETLLGAFNFRRDKIIVNSKHTVYSMKCTVGNYLPGIEKRIELIENGINLNLFKRVKPNKILSLIHGKLDNKDKVILYPHRPDPSKGIYQSLELIKKLKFEKNLKNIKILIPRYLDEKVNNDLKEHYDNIKKIARKYDIEENILFHEWIPYELMPEYYSLGNLTLSIGNFIEAFGSNVALESLACGTPVIMSRVGAQRYTLPEKIIKKVDYDDLEEATEMAKEFLDLKDKKIRHEFRKFIRKNFSHKKMLKRYAQTITNTKIVPPMEIKFINKNIKKDYVTIAPWCYLSDNKIYSDYDYKYFPISPQLFKFIKKKKYFKVLEINNKVRKEVLHLFKEGIFVFKY